MDETTFTFTTADDVEMHCHRWAPRGEPTAVIQVQHGLAEHAGRYRRFARALTDAGYLVYAPDARGSGATGRGQGGYGTWGAHGWAGWVDDVGRLNAIIRRAHPDAALGLFGHSMGSIAAQQYLLDHSADVDAVVLCGTGDPAVLAGLLDSDEPVDLSGFNSPFEHRTGYEWLSRDEREVDAYVADEACGWTAPNPPGVAEVARAADAELLAGVRPDLPVLIISGEADPIADGGGSPQRVGRRYQEAGLGDVTVRLYPQARHELLNETNRDEVTADVLAFWGRTVGA